MFLVYVPHVYASVKAGKNHDIAYPRKMAENVAKDESIDKVVSYLLPVLIHSPFLPPPPLFYFPETVTDRQTNTQTKGRILRAEAAHANNTETIGVYAAGVVAANATGVDVKTVNSLALG
jgi:hypothetical protein